MTITVDEGQNLVRAGYAALQDGNHIKAKETLQTLIDANMVNAQVWMIYALACRGAGDIAGMEMAADRILQSDNKSVRALMLKGDARAASKDSRSAISFYQSALAQAANGCPDDLKPELPRMQQYIEGQSNNYFAFVDNWLTEQGLGLNERSPRFQESLDLMAGKKEIFYQQPSAYYFPQLPQRQYYEPADFAWAREVEDATQAVLGELESVLSSDADFKPYLTSDPERPPSDFHGLQDNPDWSTYYLWENGGPVEAHVSACPESYAAMDNVPLPKIGVRAPSILFSQLKSGARIPPHTGSMNARLICHLPLIVPDNCGFRVGNEKREWQKGKLLIFDDTIEHEAWNESEKDRVILIFDIWRPELTEADRAAVTAVFQAIDSEEAKAIAS